MEDDKTGNIVVKITIKNQPSVDTSVCRKRWSSSQCIHQMFINYESKYSYNYSFNPFVSTGTHGRHSQNNMLPINYISFISTSHSYIYMKHMVLEAIYLITIFAIFGRKWMVLGLEFIKILRKKIFPKLDLSSL